MVDSAREIARYTMPRPYHAPTLAAASLRCAASARNPRPGAAVRRSATLVAAALLVAGCASVPPPSGVPQRAPPPSSGKYYLDDGPGANPPADLDAIPDAVPRLEPLHRAANRPYAVFGREYIPATTIRPYREHGIASWYGRKFHGQKTSTGEAYDMYAMTAAHPTLPLPSYARVTNVATGKSVVVRVNDRGPFLHDRIIDLSFAAAHRLGIARNGSGEVEVEAILPGAMSQSARAAQPPLPPVASAPPITAPLAPVGSASTADVALGAASVTTAPLASPAQVQPVDLMSAADSPPPQLASTAEVRPPQIDADAAPIADVRGGYSVQLGAFASFSNAQAFLARAQNQLVSVQVEPKIRQAGGLYRVYIGPYAVRSDAQRLGERITQAFGFPTTVAVH